MAQGPEAKITDRIRKRLKAVEDSWFLKVRGGVGQASGVPDILWTCSAAKGRLFAIEVKAPGGKPTELQVYTMDTMNRAGAVAFVARSVEDVIEKLAEHGVSV